MHINILAKRIPETPEASYATMSFIWLYCFIPPDAAVGFRTAIALHAAIAFYTATACFSRESSSLVFQNNLKRY